MSGPLYPKIEVKLSENDGNAFFIIGRVGQALRRNGVDHTKIKEFQEEATSGDYDNVLRTCMKWVNVS